MTVLERRLKNCICPDYYRLLICVRKQAEREHMSYTEFLELIICDELMNRTRNKHEKLIRRSRFPQHKTIEEFNFSWQPKLNRQNIYSLGTCEFIRRKGNIAFIGSPGTGKTHLSITLGLRAIEQGYSVLFLNPFGDDGRSFTAHGQIARLGRN